jgi:hypothetical protein
MLDERIMYGYNYDTITGQLIGRRDIGNYGFFSTFTLLITSIMGVYNKYGVMVKTIDGRNLLKNLNKDDSYDMYSHFFHIDESIEINFNRPMPVPLTNDDQHSIYREEYAIFYSSFFKRYFNLNDNIKNKIEEFKLKYNINPENTISVVYRSTDKWTDMDGFNHISPALYFKLTKKLKTQNPNFNTFIQSENKGINKVFIEGLNANFIEETLATNRNDLPIFLHLEKDKLEWSENYVAALFLHSKSKFLITYTGNSAFFLYLSRGTTNNLYQEITFMNNNFDDFFSINKQ